MKGKIIEGRCYKKRTQRGLFRMKKKSREELRMDQYMKTLAYIANADERATELAIKAIKAYIEKNGERLAAERASIIHTPSENPAVWFNKEYKNRFSTI